jgi:hypothetical protein
VKKADVASDREIGRRFASWRENKMNLQHVEQFGGPVGEPKTNGHDHRHRPLLPFAGLFYPNPDVLHCGNQAILNALPPKAAPSRRLKPWLLAALAKLPSTRCLRRRTAALLLSGLNQFCHEGP